ncbi:MAG: M23 family metallopeptidase [Pseudomonadota bacterium]|nr:M23 family metallopeptidase [Pseudomonadota bacterium]
MRIDTSPLTYPPPPERTSVDKAAEGFEAWFVGFLAHEALGKGLLSGKGAETFSGYFEEEIGRIVAAGPGIGLADELREAMGQTNKDSASLGGRDPAPLHAPLRAPDLEMGRVTSGYGTRRDPIDGGLRHHAGIDVAAPVGTPLHAPRDGVVRFAGTRGGYGNVVVLDHGDGTETRFAHCASLAVREGEVVREGSVIAAVGATGRATGPHVHFELRRGGRDVDPTREVTKLLSASTGEEPRGTADSSHHPAAQPSQIVSQEQAK